MAMLMVAMPTEAYDGIKRPKRRTKQFNSKESIEADRQRMECGATDSLATTATAVTAEQRPIPKRRSNTPQQIDSLLAMWRATNTVEAYDNYFNEFHAAYVAIADSLDTTNQDTLYVARMQALMSPIPLYYNHAVRDAINRFTSHNFAQTLSYAYYYFPLIEEELIKAGLPIELRAMVIIESGFRSTIESKSGAVGIWQFMPATGKQYGLEINSLIDERCNPILSTRAACRYLKNMYELYGDWTLAIASYNCGPGNVNNAIVRAGGELGSFDGSFWDVYEHLPKETRDYVPRFMGATYAFAYHKAHGIEVPLPPMPLAVDTVTIDRPMHLEQVSSTIDVELSVLEMLNPQYHMKIIPATTRTYTLTLPMERISDFVAHEAEIYAKDSMYLKEYVVHANIEKKRAEAPPAKYHIVKKDDTLGAIARKYGCTVKELVAWNNIKNPDVLSLGQKIRVSAPR